MTQTKRQIEKEIKKLRNFIDANNDKKDIEIIVKSRTAYFAEIILRWTLEDTEEWNLPLEEAIETADLILQDIEAKSEPDSDLDTKFEGLFIKENGQFINIQDLPKERYELFLDSMHKLVIAYRVLTGQR